MLATRKGDRLRWMRCCPRPLQRGPHQSLRDSFSLRRDTSLPRARGSHKSHKFRTAGDTADNGSFHTRAASKRKGKSAPCFPLWGKCPEGAIGVCRQRSPALPHLPFPGFAVKARPAKRRGCGDCGFASSAPGGAKPQSPLFVVSIREGQGRGRKRNLPLPCVVLFLPFLLDKQEKGERSALLPPLGEVPRRGNRGVPSTQSRLAAFAVCVQAPEPARKAARLRKFRPAFICPRQRRSAIPFSQGRL